jgi:hypothetical protein
MKLPSALSSAIMLKFEEWSLSFRDWNLKVPTKSTTIRSLIISLEMDRVRARARERARTRNELRKMFWRRDRSKICRLVELVFLPIKIRGAFLFSSAMTSD